MHRKIGHSLMWVFFGRILYLLFDHPVVHKVSLEFPNTSLDWWDKLKKVVCAEKYNFQSRIEDLEYPSLGVIYGPQINEYQGWPKIKRFLPKNNRIVARRKPRISHYFCIRICHSNTHSKIKKIEISDWPIFRCITNFGFVPIFYHFQNIMKIGWKWTGDSIFFRPF